MTVQKCGFVGVVGRPNVGKSTLLNRLVGQKLSITSRKPQTTRQTLNAVLTEGSTQVVFVDTPGFHTNQRNSGLNLYMNEAALSVLNRVDVILLVIDCHSWTEADTELVKNLKSTGKPVWAVINKVDRKALCLSPLPEEIRASSALAELLKLLQPKQMFPISAKHGHGVESIKSALLGTMPEGTFLYDEETVTDKSVRYLASEIVREKVVRFLGDELPYVTAVSVEGSEQIEDVLHLDLIIWVERKGQKGIVIGKGGSVLKKIGQDARKDIEQMVGQRVMLNLWVKVRDNWSDDLHQLKSLGYDSGEL